MCNVSLCVDPAFGSRNHEARGTSHKPHKEEMVRDADVGYSIRPRLSPCQTKERERREKKNRARRGLF